MTYPNNAELELLRTLEVLNRAVGDWPTGESLFEGKATGKYWNLAHPGLPGQKMRIEDVKFRTLVQLGWLDLLTPGVLPTKAFRAYITPLGQDRLEDFSASGTQVLESVRNELLQLVQGLDSDASNTVSESTVREYHYQLERLDRKGFAGKDYRVQISELRGTVRELNPDGTTRGGILNAPTGQRGVTLWRFIGPLTGAIRYIEYVLGELNKIPISSEVSETARQREPLGKTQSEAAPQPVPVFIAYSHKDAKLREALESHLSTLRRRGLVSTWYDRMISAGEEWEEVIDENLENAGIIIALISSDFIASEYCYGKELARARERHNAGEAIVIPVIVRPVDWHGLWFEDLQMLPEDAKAVTEWTNRDAALVNVAKGIRQAIDRFNCATSANQS